MTHSTTLAPPGYTRGVKPHPAITAAARLRQRMLDQRRDAEQAEQAYLDAILRLAELRGEDGQRVFSVQQIADGVGTSRGPIYKRLTRAAERAAS